MKPWNPDKHVYSSKLSNTLCIWYWVAKTWITYINGTRLPSLYS